ncbi:hypothetical protein [Deinococcus cellulosilyticus]|uniref:Uncharacterized protein n=1 Tax=Deinococcus cellulosilyticus (strain DSM 18568 / NBRC 106333 / KACC 11606 / 5516J-15) TaxID=1223518 RepID=A0A511N2X2_DEIC1|nr:hypothetical protein [Deinococcus cellulosilyticus]GEM47192.1 hypothetical protein DC3_28270 [Deinococcus cellulosilyticus NBRC 106333 = KACC 11606]
MTLSTVPSTPLYPFLQINLLPFPGQGVSGKTLTKPNLQRWEQQRQQQAWESLQKTTRMVITGLQRAGLLVREDGWRHVMTASLTNSRTCETVTIYKAFFFLEGVAAFQTVGGTGLPDPIIGKDWSK